MQILYGRVFGLGNAVCSVPAIKALSLAGHTVDVIVGKGSDDGGAYDVLRNLAKNGVCRNVSIDSRDNGQIPPFHYDSAIMAIPFDGRWRDGIDFQADHVIDCRPRPEFAKELGFSSWKKHEVEYQMENAYALGYSGSVPDCSFLCEGDTLHNTKQVYLGMGYKKDAAGFWKQKHWGNENYAALINRILSSDPDIRIVTTGDILDIKHTIGPVTNLIGPVYRDRFILGHPLQIRKSFETVAACQTYVGNDTGMMHVAASCGLGVVSYFKLENASTKSRPWCKNYEVIEGAHQEVTVEQFYQAFRRVHYGENR